MMHILQTVTKPARTLLWLLLTLVVLGIPTTSWGQCLPNEVIKQVKVTTPANFQQNQPFRTNRSQINIGFEHDGASGSYLVHTEGADVQGSTFLALPTDKSGNVGAGFNIDGVKQVGVIVFQQKCNVVVDSRASPASGGAQAFIQYDTKPPVITLQSVTLGPNPPNLPVPFNGQTFTTKEDQMIVTGTVTDPDNGSPAAEIKLTIKNTGNNQTVPAQIDAATGTFTANVALAGINDGALELQLVAEDKMTDPQATPNKSDPTVIKVIRDKKAPTVQQIELIRFNDDPARRQVLSPGIKTFVGQETIFIRVTMSEKMASPPQVNVTQQGGVAIPAVIRQEQTVNDTVFLFQYSVIPVEAQNGPARVQITGAFDGAGPLPDFGYDLANNPIAQNDTSATIANAFSVDTVAPDLDRLPTPPPPGKFVSVPADGSVIGKDQFPKQLQVYVDDFNTSTRTDTAKNLASGVDFTTVANEASTSTTAGLSLSIRGPAGDIPGTPSVSPPTGMFLNFPNYTGATPENANFTDRDGDGVREPVDGSYTITVNLIDKVGNRSTKTITFRVDTIPVSTESLTATPLGCLSLQQREFPPVVVGSKDPDFSVTSTNVEFFSQIGGPNSVPVKFDSDTPARSVPGPNVTTVSITLNNIRKPGQAVGADNWPNPISAAPEFVPPGYLDPRTGNNDGAYFTRVTPKDVSGNSGTVSTTNTRRAAFVDFPVYIDNTDPFVERTYPLVDRPIAGPLSFIEAVVVDPAATNGNAGCGIDVNQTAIVARMEVAYRPNQVNNSFLETPGTFPSRLRGTIKFTHIPNSLDPTRNDYNPRDDRYRVALEFTDPVTGRTRPLPTDGSMDGIYSIAVNPVDKANNSLDINPLSPSRLGNYFGLKPAPDSTINLAQFFFLFENVAPKLEVSLQDGTVLANGPGILSGGNSKVESAPRAAVATPTALFGARPFHIEGFVSDLSAQGQIFGSSQSNHFGGADVDRVEYKLEVVDEQFLPIPSIAPTNGPKEGEIIPGRSNPVIPLTTAVLDPVQTPANVATRSTTHSLEAGFAATLRERRKFVIDDVLPPDSLLLKPRDNQQGDHYQFTIRVVDRAGNVTSLQKVVRVNLDDVKPPRLTSPADNTYTKSQVAQFRWANVQDIKKFRFTLTFPAGSPMASYTKIIEKTSAEDETKNVVQMTLPYQGQYKWTVTSFDQVGNEGAAAPEFKLNVDVTAPGLVGNSATVTGDVQPTNRSGVLGIGTFNVRLQFDETLKTAPWVSWQPASPSTAAVLLTTMSFTGSVLQAQGQIPGDADPKIYDGRASLVIGGVVDLAGNAINSQNQVTIDGFEVDTGPFFQTKFFVNPVNPAELTLVVLASEELQIPPRFTGLAGLTQLTNDAFRMAASSKAYYTSLKISQPNSDLNGKVTISGTDLDGNVSRREVRLTMKKVTKTIASKMLATEHGFALEIPAGAVSQDTNVFLFPASGDVPTEGLEVAGPAKAAAAAAASAPSGLVDLGALPDAQPYGLEFQVPATVSADVATRGLPVRQVGVYQHDGTRWRWVGGVGPDGRVSGPIRTLAPLRLMADTVAPRIPEMEPADGERLETGRPEITATIVDAGSGVDPAGIAVKLDGQPIPVTYDETTGRMSCALVRELSPGEHGLEVTVTDRAGNPGPVQKIGLVAPDQFGFREQVMAVPNPIRGLTAGFSLALTQPAATRRVSLELYDAAGRRLRVLSADAPFAGPRMTLDWDLLDDDGRLVQNGVYLFRAKAVSFTGSKAQSKGKLAVLR